MTYTIDLDGSDGRWRWMLYTRGGTIRLGDGSAETIDQASFEARARMLVEHRQSQTDATSTAGAK